MHPYWGKGSDDEVYAKGQANAEADKETFKRRYRKSLTKV